MNNVVKNVVKRFHDVADVAPNVCIHLTQVYLCDHGKGRVRPKFAEVGETNTRNLSGAVFASASAD